MLASPDRSERQNRGCPSRPSGEAPRRLGLRYRLRFRSTLTANYAEGIDRPNRRNHRGDPSPCRRLLAAATAASRSQERRRNASGCSTAGRLAKLEIVANKNDLKDWVIEALESMSGSGSVVDVSRVVWQRHEHDLRLSGDMFYTWQYDIRWAGQKLRDEGLLVSAQGDRRAPWRLA